MNSLLLPCTKTHRSVALALLQKVIFLIPTCQKLKVLLKGIDQNPLYYNMLADINWRDRPYESLEGAPDLRVIAEITLN